MGYFVCNVEPPATTAEECLGCEYAHPPGMLCREQRTALTTAKARGESKRDLGQVVMRLRSPSESSEVASKGLEARRRTLSRMNSMESTASVIVNDVEKELFSAVESSSTRLVAGRSAESKVVKPSLIASTEIVKKTHANSNTHSGNSSHRSLRKTCSKFTEALVWLCLVGLMQSQCAWAAPRPAPPSARAMAAAPAGPPKWINPCGMGSSDNVVAQDIEMPSVSDQELLGQVVVQAKTALSEANRYKEDYVKKTFNVDFEEHHKSWIHSSYDWLPSKSMVPKNLGENVQQNYLDEIKDQVDETLAQTYSHLQRFAVGLEQVATDQRANGGPFKDLFSGAEYKLRALLCEIQVVLIEHGAQRRADITRDVMDGQFRDLDTSNRNLRDWIIYRDYMNMLEYVIEVFEYYSSNLS